MKTWIVQSTLILLLIVGNGIASYGQPPVGSPAHDHGPGDGHHHGDDMPEDKIKALKIAYLTSKLNLTTDEAQAFWPIYNAYQDAKFEVHKAQMTLSRKLKDQLDALTDTELNKLLDEYIALEQKEASLKVEYLQKFRKILPVRKVALLQKAEHDFKAEVLRQLKKRGPGGPGGPPPGSDN